MFIHKLAILSLVLVPSLGAKLHLRKAVVDPNTTYYLDSSLSFDNSTMNDIDFINQGYNDLETFEYNTTVDLSTDDTLDDDGGGRLERKLGWQGDWSQCSSSSQCGSGCCSGKYSNGVLKCTPLGSGFNPTANGCVSAGGSSRGTCGGGSRGDGVCSSGQCCSPWGWCGTSPQHCTSGSGGGGNSNNGGTTDSNAWIQAHNVRRQKYHAMYGKSYVPLKWSSSLENSARAWANNLVGSCSLTHDDNRKTGQGENLALEKGSSGYSPDQVLNMWVDKEDPARFNNQFVVIENGHFSQALWRGTKYVGCASASRSGCFIQVCRYVRMGNCGIGGNEWRWADLVFADSSGCGPQCPAEGCF